MSLDYNRKGAALGKAQYLSGITSYREDIGRFVAMGVLR